MSWRTEKKEHKWATIAQAKRIAKDHAHLKHERKETSTQERREHNHKPRKGHQGLFDQKVPLQYLPKLYSGLDKADKRAHKLVRGTK